MTDLLDLDAVAPPKRHLQLGGERYEIRTASLGDYLQMLRDAERMQKRIESGAATESELIEHHLKSVAANIPGLPEDKLKKLTGQQLQAIVTFMRETASDATEESGEKAEGQKGKAEAPQ